MASPSDAAHEVTIADVAQGLRGVVDPELGLSVIDLGLIYAIDISGREVAITMTLTAPGCPLHDVMPDWVREAVKQVPGVGRVAVTVTFDPPWTPDRMTRR